MNAIYIDESASFLAGIEGQIEKEKQNLTVLDSERTRELGNNKLKHDATVDRCCKDMAAEYHTLIETVRKDIVNDLSYISSDSDSPWSLDSFPLKDTLLEQANSHFIQPELLVGKKYVDLGMGYKFLVPQYLPWQSTQVNSFSNILISYDKHLNEKAKEFANNILVRMLMAFAPGDINFTFIDPLASNGASYFLKVLKDVPELFYDRAFTSDDQIKEQIKALERKMAEVQQLLPLGYNTITAYNVERGKVAKPYEVVVIYDYGCERLNQIYQEFLPFIENGNKYGIYLVVLQPNAESNSNTSSYVKDLNSSGKFNTINCLDHYCTLTILGHSLPIDSIYINDDLKTGEQNIIDVVGLPNKMMADYFVSLSKRLDDRRKQKKVDIDLSIYDNSFEDASKEFSLPIGKINDETTFSFVLDESTKAHTFILGKTGSGKSVLLHALLTTAVLKYSPETLQLYLMDFKEGGVEFNEYVEIEDEKEKDRKFKIPHARAVLVENSDRQVVLEIMQNIAKEMKRRGELFRNEKVQNLRMYNEKNPNNKLPRIIIGIDECHVLFSRRTDAITDIITKVSTEGRSQGVHLIMATQTLYDSNIPDTVLKNMANKLVLSSDAPDAIKLLNETVDVHKLLPGETMFRSGPELTKFHTNYLDKKKRTELLRKSYWKASESFNNEEGLASRFPTFVFKGRQEPQISDVESEVIGKGASMILGKEIGMNEKAYVQIPIHRSEYASNLLIIGNRELDEGEAEANAMRVVIASIFTLKDYYQRTGKGYKIYIINRLNEVENEHAAILEKLDDEDSHCKILANQVEIERTLVDLRQTAMNNESAQEDTYIYFLGMQKFVELRRKAEVRSLAVPETGSDSEFSFLDTKKQTYAMVIRDIVANGPGCGIHTIIQVDKNASLMELLYEASYGSDTVPFNYTVLLSTPNSDIPRVFKNKEVDAENLSTDSHKLRAYLLNESNDKLSLFVPFVLPPEEFVNHKI